MTLAQRDTVSTTLTDATGYGGTFTIPYPEGRGAEDYLGGTKHKLRSDSTRTIMAEYGDFSLTFGASNITVTSNTNVAYPLGEAVYLELDRAEGGPAMDGIPPTDEAMADPKTMSAMSTIKVNLGQPNTADADGAVASQAATAAGGLATGINGALASGGVATFDVPRNVVAAWTTAAVLTVTGTDAYGNIIVESSASGTSFAGKKAFKTVTGIAVSANVTGLTVGTGEVLGLPVFLADDVDVLAEIQDGAAATAGTIVAGDTTSPATATTGDVRGTYDPNAAANGSRQFELVMAVRSTSYKGVDQYSG